MEGEREKNRLRKMKAVQGREWDAEKNEDDLVGPRDGAARSRYRRGAHGGVAGDERMRYHDGEYRGRTDYGYAPRGPRGRGGRGGRGARGDNTLGRGRGGGHQSQLNNTLPDTSAESEFPALPTSTTATKTTGQAEDDGKIQNKEDPPIPGDATGAPLIYSPGIERGTWAEQMEVGT